MRIKLIHTINYFKEKFYYLLFKNGHYNSGIVQTIEQEVKKMNTMDLLSTLWIIGNLKTKSHKHNHNNYKKNSISPIDGKMTEGIKGVKIQKDLTRNQDHQIKHLQS